MHQALPSVDRVVLWALLLIGRSRLLEMFSWIQKFNLVLLERFEAPAQQQKPLGKLGFWQHASVLGVPILWATRLVFALASVNIHHARDKVCAMPT